MRMDAEDRKQQTSYELSDYRCTRVLKLILFSSTKVRRPSHRNEKPNTKEAKALQLTDSGHSIFAPFFIKYFTTPNISSTSRIIYSKNIALKYSANVRYGWGRLFDDNFILLLAISGTNNIRSSWTAVVTQMFFFIRSWQTIPDPTTILTISLCFSNLSTSRPILVWRTKYVVPLSSESECFFMSHAYDRFWDRCIPQP